MLILNPKKLTFKINYYARHMLLISVFRWQRQVELQECEASLPKITRPVKDTYRNRISKTPANKKINHHKFLLCVREILFLE